MRLKDKVAIVTGSGRGIGRDIALAYAREGAHVVVNDIDPATAAATAADVAKAGGQEPRVAADVARKADVDRLIDATIGRVRPDRHPGQQRHEDRARQARGTHRGGVGHDDEHRAARGVPDEPGGRAAHDRAEVRARSSTSPRSPACFPYNWAGSYSVVKAGLIMLTKLQAMEWAPYGIRANAITPGYIRTPGTEAMYADPEIYEGRRKGVPMGRVGSGEDITGVAVFLAQRRRPATRPAASSAPTAGRRSAISSRCRARRFSGGRMD